FGDAKKSAEVGVDVVLDKVGFNRALQAAANLNNKHGEGNNQPLAVAKHGTYVFQNFGSFYRLFCVTFRVNILFWIVALARPGKAAKKSEDADDGEQCDGEREAQL